MCDFVYWIFGFEYFKQKCVGCLVILFVIQCGDGDQLIDGI